MQLKHQQFEKAAYALFAGAIAILLVICHATQLEPVLVKECLWLTKTANVLLAGSFGAWALKLKFQAA